MRICSSITRNVFSETVLRRRNLWEERSERQEDRGREGEVGEGMKEEEERREIERREKRRERGILRNKKEINGKGILE